MHGAHQHTVGQCQMTHLKRLKKMRIAHAELLLGRVTGISNNCMIVECKVQKKNKLRNQYEKTPEPKLGGDRKSTRLNSSHVAISYAVFCLKKKNDELTKNKHDKTQKTYKKNTYVEDHNIQKPNHKQNTLRI